MAKKREVWEYLVLTDRYDDSARSDQQRFNALGADGWELVSVEPHPDWRRFYFKRRKVS